MSPEALLKRVRTIELKTKGIAQQLFSGEYQSAFKGRGMSFSEVRSYQFGDDVRTIDWNVTARFQAPYIKVFEEERELQVMLLIDCSQSMYFGQNEESKWVTALDAIATIAFSAAKKNDKVGAIFVTDHVEHYIRPEKGIPHVYALLKRLIYFKPSSTMTHLPIGLEFIQKVLKQRSTCFILSDFTQTSSLRNNLLACSKQHDLVALQFADPGEEILPDLGFVQWTNTETGETTWVDTSDASVREKYFNQQQNRLEQNKSFFATVGIDYCELASGKDVHPPLLRLFKKHR